MKKYLKWNMALALGLSIIFVSACSNGDTVEEEQAEEAVEADLEQEQPQEDAATEEEDVNSSEAVDLELEPSQGPDETDAEAVEKMEAEEGVEDAMVYVTEDGYVLVTMMVTEDVDTETAETLAQEYGDELLSTYPDHIIDIEIMQGDEFLAQVVLGEE